MRPVITARKHYVANTLLTITSAATREVFVVNAVVAPATGTSADTVEGSVIKAVFIEDWLVTDKDATDSTQFIYIILKLPSGLDAPGIGDMLNLGAYDNKKNILFMSQGALVQSGGQAIPVHRGWIKIPKGKQRFGLGDRLAVVISSIGQSIQNCGFKTYKEYS